ncbi:MAG: hypothetical protein HFI29_07175 [Lachnospiraceae bacterium]|jgi:uncharacterized lipoprotein YehR (DUF1307 family)|nr:hypothetical protein [Lachnospiraceae bacterium]
MKKRNRLIALLLTMALSISLAACGNDKAEGGETQGPARVEAEEDMADDASEEAEAPEEEKDPFEAAR